MVEMSIMLDYLHETDDDEDNDSIIPSDERRYRELLRLTIGTLRTHSIRGTYWSTDVSARNC